MFVRVREFVLWFVVVVVCVFVVLVVLSCVLVCGVLWALFVVFLLLIVGCWLRFVLVVAYSLFVVCRRS